jgi:hypothetical protein
MAVKDFTKMLTPNLEITVGNNSYSIRPPSKEDGKVMMAINIVGVQAFNTATAATEMNVDPAIQLLVDANADRDLGELSLRNEYARMCEELDGPLVEKLELYAFYYWILGEHFADQWLEAFEMARSGETPKAPQAPKSGHSTGLAKSSGTRKQARRSTPTTASRKK